MKKHALKFIAAICVLAATTAAFGQVLNTNGNFEGGWTTVVPAAGSSPALGKPLTGWVTSYAQGVGEYQVGGTYAALVIGGTANTGTSSGNITTSPSISSSPTAFVAKFDVALGAGTTMNAPGTGAGTVTDGNGRLFQMYLNNGSTQVTNLIISQGSTANTANVLIRKAGAWVQIGAFNALTTSGAYDYTTNSFANALTFYTFTITMRDFALTSGETGTGILYDISCDLRGGGNVFTATDLDGVFNAANTTGLSALAFTGGFAGATSGTSFLLDNVSVSAIPEPTSLALIAGGLLLLCGRQVRRKY